MEETKECNPSEAPAEESTSIEIPEKMKRKLTPSQHLLKVERKGGRKKL